MLASYGPLTKRHLKWTIRTNTRNYRPYSPAAIKKTLRQRLRTRTNLTARPHP